MGIQIIWAIVYLAIRILEVNPLKELRDWEVLYTERFETRSDAYTREMEIKKKKSREYIQWLISSAKKRPYY